MTPEERRRMRLARTGPLSSGIPNPRFRNNPEIGMPISDKAWYEIPPHMTLPNGSRYGTISGYREGLDPSTGEPIFPYRDQTVLDYLQSKRPTSTPTSVGGGYDPFGVVPPTSVGGGYDPIGFVPTTSVGGGWDLFPEGQPSTVSSIPALDESYSVAGRDIQSEVADEINETIRLQALSAEEWEREKLKLIQSDNKMELAVALLTGTAPNLTSVASAMSGPAASATATAKNNLEKSKLAEEWLKNPPTTQDQIIEFGSRFNASPSGWAFIKSMKPMFDWGDVIEWKKLMPDGTVDYKYARKGDVKRNALLRGENFRTGSLADDRAVVADQKFSEASSELSSFLGNRILTQELLNEFMQQNKSLLLDPKKVAAISTLAKMYDLKPSYDTFTVIGKGYKVGDTEMPIGYQFPVRVGSDTWKSGIKNSKLQILSDTDAYKIPTDKIHRKSMDRLYEDLKGMNLIDRFIAEEKIKEEGAKAQGNTFGFVFDPEKDTQSLLSRLGLGTGTAVHRELAQRHFNSLIQAKNPDGSNFYTLPQIKEMMLNFVVDMDIDNAYINDLIGQADKIREPEKYAESVDLPVTTEIRNGVLVEKPGGKGVRTSETTIEPITIDRPEEENTIGKVIGKTPRGWLLENGKEYIDPNHMRDKEQSNIKEIVTKRVRDPEGFTNARESYNQMWTALFEAGDDPSAWGTTDKVIGEIFKKLRDKSMITENEFDALKRTTGVWDRWGNWIRTTLQTGESFTGSQKRAIINAAYAWFIQKQKDLLAEVGPYRESFQARFSDDKVTIPPGYGIDDLFNMAGVPWGWMNSTVKDPEVLFEEHPEYFKVTEGEDGAEVITETPGGLNPSTDIKMDSVYPADWTVRIDGVWVPYDEKKHKHLLDN